MLLKINHSLDAIDRTRYHAVVAKYQAEALTVDEQLDRIALSDRIEAAAAQRMTYLVELARVRATPLTTLFHDLGLNPRADG